MKFMAYLFYLFLMLFIAGCASFQTIEQPNTPHERPGYIMYSPKDYGWHFKEFDSSKHTIGFFKTPKEIDHTVYGKVEEIPSLAKFDKPDDFLSFMKNLFLLDYNPKRFNVLEEEMKLVNDFGDYTVSFYNSSEDHGAFIRNGDVPFLVMKTSGYYFIPPGSKNQIISIFYSERGRVGDLDPNFEANAREFINGLKIKSK